MRCYCYCYCLCFADCYCYCDLAYGPVRWSEILSPLSPSCTVTEPTWTNTNIQKMMKIVVTIMMTILQCDQTNQLVQSLLSQFRMIANMVARWVMLNQNVQKLKDQIGSRPPCAPDSHDPPRQRTHREEIETWKDYKRIFYHCHPVVIQYIYVSFRLLCTL